MEAAAAAPIHAGLGHLFCPLAESLAWGGLGVPAHGAALPPGLMATATPLAVPDPRASASGPVDQVPPPPPSSQCGGDSPAHAADADSGFASAMGHPPHAVRDAAVLMREFGDAVDPHLHQHVHHFHPGRLPPPIPGYIPVVRLSSCASRLTWCPVLQVSRPEMFPADLFTPGLAGLPAFHPYFAYQPNFAQSARLADYLRMYQQPRHNAPQNRGASRTTIERNTFAHKYKKMKKSIDEDREEDIEKCTICLSEFEVEEDVR